MNRNTNVPATGDDGNVSLADDFASEIEDWKYEQDLELALHFSLTDMEVDSRTLAQTIRMRRHSCITSSKTNN